MSVDIKGSHKGSPSFTFGAGQFANLRQNVAKAILGDRISIYTEWLATDEQTPKDKLSRKCRALYDAIGDAAYNFVVQSDCEGKLTIKQTRELYEAIKNKPGNWSLRYLFYQKPENKNDFIELLRSCTENKSKLVWY